MLDVSYDICASCSFLVANTRDSACSALCVCARVFFEKPEHGALMSAKSAVANLMTFLDSKRNGDTRMS
jgi:hypothetical protein